MGKVKSHTPKLTKKFYPFVTVCTPTFNRRPFFPVLFQCFLNQTYPKDRMEWVIVDDGTDSIEDLVIKSGIKQIQYFREEKKMTLGQKRNYMHTKAKGAIIVYMDDDDYYPPERVSHAVDTLNENREAMCAGASEIYIYFKHIQQLWQAGPYNPNHATAGTFAFRTELLKHTQYEDHASLAEEKQFLKNYTVPFAQLDPLKTILVFSHEHNTFDKRKLLENPHPQYFRPSIDKTVDSFIRNAKESAIKNFFLKDIDTALLAYEPGLPRMKPDVLQQIKEIAEERKKMSQGECQGQVQFMINEPGKPPRALSNEEIAQHMNGCLEKIRELTEKNKSLERIISNLQEKLAELNQTRVMESKVNELQTQLSELDTKIGKITHETYPSTKSKTIPEVRISI
uniref:Glycosyltransferase 2-like domain-containing protein n=1 Tax=viral metagenome TaxID=1070528 RepID=A0A6C0DX64_9ZZZZ